MGNSYKTSAEQADLFLHERVVYEDKCGKKDCSAAEISINRKSGRTTESFYSISIFVRSAFSVSSALICACFTRLLLFLKDVFCRTAGVLLEIVSARLCIRHLFILIMSLVLVVAGHQISYGKVRIKHFLSYGSSTASLGAGESTFSSWSDPSILHYNPSLIAFFNENALNLSIFDLSEQTHYKSGTAVVGLGWKIFLGFSVFDLLSENIKVVRKNLKSPQNFFIDKRAYILSVARFTDYLNISYGLNVKYIYYKLYSKEIDAYAFDCGLSKNFNVKDILEVRLGISVRNLVSDKSLGEIPAVARFSSAFIFPVYYRLESMDTLNIYADVEYEDDFAGFYGGMSYIIADKYTLRVGYYSPEHFTLGVGIGFYSFTVDYAADFYNTGLVNRLGLTYKWRFGKSAGLSKEALVALNKEKINFKDAEQKFKEAKRLYNKKEYLRATDMLSDIIVARPGYEFPQRLRDEIVNMMEKTAGDRGESDFGKLTYAKAYVAYYAAEYEKALSEWRKYIDFVGVAGEVREYVKKIDSVLKLRRLEKREAELDRQAKKMLEDGIEKYSLRKWMQCIKMMEALEKFVNKNNFSKTLEYCKKAKEYIDKSVAELSKSVLTPKKTVIEPEPEKHREEKLEYDEVTADKKYTEGLVLYAQGKYYEAERLWELTLRLNPYHQKAKIALHKLKNSVVD